MKYRYIAHPAKAVVAILTAVVLILGGIDLALGMKWYATIFLVLGAVFVYVAAIYGVLVTVTQQGVQASLLGLWQRTLTWEQIGEIGVVGTRVFNNANPTPGKSKQSQGARAAFYSKSPRIGTPYIYFSPESLTEQERFELALKWPPRGMIFLRYSPQRMEVVRQLSLREVERYNTGNLLI